MTDLQQIPKIPVPLPGDGYLTFTVWPPYAGAVQSNGDEPMFGLDYMRGQIFWEMNEKGLLRGRTVIYVPAGEWTWIIYCHSQFRPGFASAQKLAHPLVLYEPGTITLSDITEEEVRPFSPDPVLRD